MLGRSVELGARRITNDNNLDLDHNCIGLCKGKHFCFYRFVLSEELHVADCLVHDRRQLSGPRLQLHRALQGQAILLLSVCSF